MGGSNEVRRDIYQIEKGKEGAGDNGRRRGGHGFKGK